MNRFFKNKHRLTIALIFITLVLSGCSIVYQEQEVESYIVDTSELLASGYSFDKVSVRRFLEVEELYSVDDEQELALLVLKNFEKGELTTRYISDNELSLQRVYLFVETLLYDSYYLQAGVMQYGDMFQSNQQEVRFIDVVLDENLLKSNHQYATYIVSDLSVNQLPARKQVKEIHDYIVLNTKYDEALLDLDISAYQNHPSFTPYGVYHHNVAVCSGYARAFMQLTRMMDIPSIMVSSQNMNHAWNMVYVDNEWKFLDVTWNDPIPDVQDRVLYTYYLLDYNEFVAKGHHFFDLASENTLSIEEVVDFANYAFVLNP